MKTTLTFFLLLCAGCAGVDPKDAPDAGAEALGADAAIPCTSSAECQPFGLFCHIGETGMFESGTGHCAAPSATVVPCAGGRPEDGDPCDPAELPAGTWCRQSSCAAFCLPTCECSASRWSCTRLCVDANARGPDGGLACECGSPPYCLRTCRCSQ